MSTPRVRAVVFDFDGVIIESGDIKTEAFLELFAAYPEHLPAIKRHHLDHLAPHQPLAAERTRVLDLLADRHAVAEFR